MKRLVVLVLLAVVLASCKKGAPEESEPETSLPVITGKIIGGWYDGVQIQATLVSDGGSPLTEHGVCWGTAPNPTMSANKIPTQSILEFVEIKHLPLNVKHYFRCYAVNKKGVAYGNEIEFTAQLSAGMEYAGGKVVYIEDSGIHGLVVSSENLGSAKFDNVPDNFYSSKAFSVSDGKGNTDKIIATYGYNGNAAAKCRMYRGGGYSDWYLPAMEQLHRIYNSASNDKTFANYYYWSSTEDSSYIGNAWCIGFHNEVYGTSLKSFSYMVRAVRDF